MKDSNIFVLLDSEEKPLLDINNDLASKNSVDCLAPSDKIPKPPKEGYSIQPSLVELSRMTIKQLGEVESLCVYN